MKKFLLPGMVAALALAACTNEEIVSQQTAAVPEADLSKRPVVGMVDLTFGPQSQTRLALDEDANFNTIEWKVGDKMGARIIDEPINPMKNYKDHSVRYVANDQYASSNYKYTRDANGLWSTEALMVEGHYMFYAPYDESARDRSPLKIQFPLVQTVNPKADLMAGVNVDAIRRFIGEQKHVVGVGHAFISAADEETTYTPEFAHLYAYPMLTLVNNVPDPEWEAPKGDDEAKNPGMTISIDSIKVYGAGIFAEYQADHAGIIAALRKHVAIDAPTVKNNPELFNANGTRKDGFEDYDGVWEDGKYHDLWAGYWRKDNDTTVYKKASTNDILDAQGTAKGAIKVEFTEPLQLAAGAEYKLNVILPAQSYSGLSVEVYSDGEVLKHEVSSGTVQQFALRGMTFTPGKRYPYEEYNFENGVASAKSTAGTSATVKLEGQFAPYVAPVQNNISSLKEFAIWLSKYATTNDLELTEGMGGDNVLQQSEFLFVEKDGYSVVPLNKALMDTIAVYLKDGKISFSSNFLMEGDVEIDSRVKKIGKITAAKDDKGKAKTANLTIKHAMTVGDINVTSAKLTNVTGGAITLAGESELNGGLFGAATFNGSINLNNGVKFSSNVSLNAGGNINNAELPANKALTFMSANNVKITKLTGAKAATINGGKVTIVAIPEDANAADYNVALDFSVKNSGVLVVERANYTNEITLGETKPDDKGNTVSKSTGKLSLKADNDLAHVVLNSGEVSIDEGTATVSYGFYGSNWTLGKLSNNATMIANQLIIKKGNEYVHNGDIVASALNITNNGKITNKAGKSLTVATNNGDIEVEQGTFTTISAGTGTVNNNAKARVIVNNAAAQTVYYTFNEAVDNAVLDAFDAKRYGVNKVIFTKAVTLENFKDGSTALDGVRIADFNAGSSLYVDGLIGSSLNTININDNVTMTGYAGLDDAYAVGFGFKFGGTINVAAGKTLTVTRMNLVTMSATTGLDINLLQTTDDEGKVTAQAKIKVDAARIGVGVAATPAVANTTLVNGGEIKNLYYDGSWNSSTEVTATADSY